MPKVSVIVPVYRVEQYLAQCVESIINQTLTDIEIILVDDGSTDACGSMCDAYAVQDSRIKVIHKENGGLSSARNAALDIATGEFIGFVDSDDYIAPDMYEKMYANALKYNSDLVMCGFYEMGKNGTWFSQNPNLPEGAYSREEVLERMIIPLMGNDRSYSEKNCNGYVWMCIFKGSLISENHLRFRSEREVFHEDEVFQLDFHTHIYRASSVDMPLYYYRYNQKSLSRTPHVWHMWEAGKNLTSFFRDFSRRCGIEERSARRIDMYLLFYVINSVRSECVGSLYQGTARKHIEKLRTIFTDPEVQRILSTPLPTGESRPNRFILFMARRKCPAIVYFTYHFYYKFIKKDR